MNIIKYILKENSGSKVNGIFVVRESGQRISQTLQRVMMSFFIKIMEIQRMKSLEK